MPNNLFINKEKWSSILDSIGASKSSRRIIRKTISLEQKKLEDVGVLGEDMGSLREEWHSDLPFFDAAKNPFVLFIYDQTSIKYFKNKQKEEGVSTYKFHICWCQTLENMTASGRRGRYKAKYNIANNIFNVNQDNVADEELEMNVCKNCLKEIDYKDYKEAQYIDKNSIYNEFNISAFFEEYSLPDLPRPTHQNHTGKYTENWSNISKKIKNERGNKCEECGSDIGLQTHHINGIKDDNRSSNLKVLCWKHHKAQPMHGHMRTPF